MSSCCGTPSWLPGVLPIAFAAQAVRWVRANADELCIDRERVSLLGFSAGGHVAALLGTHWHRDDLAAAERAEYEASGRLDLPGFPATGPLG